ncbi:MAG: hypothetical protein H0U23_02500 [Blastocatellia bacterium]|nr:hypothetical protein [Blastocatellia bacterium]
MDTREVSSKYSERSTISMVAAAIGGLLVGGAAVYFITFERLLEEPRTTYVVNFTDAELRRPEDRGKFVAALADLEVNFRRDLGIKVGDDCDPNELPNHNVDEFPKNNCKQPEMGQQVTQRVGFKNIEYLKEALKYVK